MARTSVHRFYVFIFFVRYNFDAVIFRCVPTAPTVTVVAFFFSETNKRKV